MILDEVAAACARRRGARQRRAKCPAGGAQGAGGKPCREETSAFEKALSRPEMPHSSARSQARSRRRKGVIAPQFDYLGIARALRGGGRGLHLGADRAGVVPRARYDIFRAELRMAVRCSPVCSKDFTVDEYHALRGEAARRRRRCCCICSAAGRGYSCGEYLARLRTRSACPSLVEAHDESGDRVPRSAAGCAGHRRQQPQPEGFHGRHRTMQRQAARGLCRTGVGLRRGERRIRTPEDAAAAACSARGGRGADRRSAHAGARQGGDAARR